MQTHHCKICGLPFEPKEWQKQKHEWKCNPCMRIEKQAYRDARKAAGNPTKPGRMSKEYEKARTAVYYQIPHVKQRRAALMQSYRANPALRHKHLARNAVTKAIRSGQMTRQPCELCGKLAQAHHDDYDKPLDVRWLCHSHHTEHHARATGAA